MKIQLAILAVVCSAFANAQEQQRKMMIYSGEILDFNSSQPLKTRSSSTNALIGWATPVKINDASVWKIHSKSEAVLGYMTELKTTREHHDKQGKRVKVEYQGLVLDKNRKLVGTITNTSHLWSKPTLTADQSVGGYSGAMVWPGHEALKYTGIKMLSKSGRKTGSLNMRETSWLVHGSFPWATDP